MSEPSKWANEAAARLYDSPDHSIWLSHGSFLQYCQQAVDHATAEKDRKIAELEESFAMSQAARKEWLAVFDGYKLTIVQQQQRLSEARFLIELIQSPGIDRADTNVIKAASKWLEKTP